MAEARRHASAPKRLYVEWLAVALAATLLIVALIEGRLTERLDNIIYDRALTASERPPPDDIIVIAIDNRSLQGIGRWPWPRAIHAQALDRLADAKPRAIGYDVLFVEPTADDAILAAAVARSRTYLPMVVDVPGSNGAPYDLALPAGPLASAATAIAQVNLHFDGDRVIRKAYLQEGSGGDSWLQLGALMAGLHAASGEQNDQSGLWQKRPILIPYSGSAGHIRSISFIDILQGRVPPELIADRYILVGATADGMGDGYPTPTSGETSQMPGVEIQAHMLDALLRGDAITPAPAPWVMALALIATWLLLAAFLHLGPRGTARLAIASLIAVLLLSFALFYFAHVWLPPTAALIGLIFVYPIWSWRRLQAVSSYMTDELRQLSREPDDFPRAAVAVESAREVTLQLTLLGQAIGRLRDLRRFLADSLRNIPDALFVTDLEGRLLLTNAEGRQLLGRLSLENRHLSDLHPLFGFMRPSDDAEWLDPFASGSGEHGQAEVVIEDIGHFDIHYVSQFDADNRRVGLIIRMVDMTRLKRAERHREEALQLLSHDMRAPQSSILTVLERSRGEVPEDIAARIGNYARRTLDLAEDFVQLARAEAKPLDREEVDVNDIVIDAADALWPQASTRRITIDTMTGEEPALMLGDRQLLTRAIVNLIGNAIKYSEDNTTISCTVALISDAVRVAIVDEGTGMTPEQLERLFGRFQQGPREGVGLGLAMVQMVVQRHNGSIRCDSAVGRGTTFTIDLPPLPSGNALLGGERLC